MNNVSQKLHYQIDVMKGQKNISLQGPIGEVNNYIQALSRIYELAEYVAKMERKLDEIKQATIGVSAKNAEDTLYLIAEILDE